MNKLLKNIFKLFSLYIKKILKIPIYQKFIYTKNLKIPIYQKIPKIPIYQKFKNSYIPKKI